MAAYEVNPARMALINVDMQLAFVEGTPLSAANGVALLGIVNKLSAACRAAGIMVIHTKHTTRADGTNLGTMGVLCDPVREGYIQEGTKTVELHAGLDVEPGDIVLEKPRYGAFSGTDLDMILRGNDIDTIIVSGICTNICCETTAREAGMRDYFVFFMEVGTDTFATGGLTVEDIIRATNATIACVFGRVIKVDDMIGRVQAAHRHATAAE